MTDTQEATTTHGTNARPGAGRDLAAWALTSSLLGLACLALMYWLVLPAVVLGLVGILLGFLARSKASAHGLGRDLATAAICCGAIAVLFTPVTLMQTGGAEDWGRDCASRPDHDPNC